MIKISALDFLRKETFETDVMTVSGDILFSSGDKVTPEILLSLYFKDIYVSESFAPVIEAAKAARAAGMSSSMPGFSEFGGGTAVEEKDVARKGFVKVSEDDQVKAAEEAEEARKVQLLRELQAQAPKKLVFDEEQAARVAKYALEIAKAIGMNEETSKELEKAAYYHKVGVVGFTTEDKLQPGFREKVAKASYSCMLKQMKLSDEVADVATLYYTNYVPSNFELNKKKGSYIPFYHIVAIASYYDEFLTATSSKEEAIMKMLRLGGNKFNTFILHKFIYRMRMKND